MNFSKRFRAGKKATTGFPLETALSLLLSIRPASRLFVCVCWVGRERLAKMARKKADDAASCFRASQAMHHRVCLVCGTTPHSIPPPPPIPTGLPRRPLVILSSSVAGFLVVGVLLFAVRCSMHHHHRAAPSPPWPCPSARHPRGRHLCGLPCVESEDGSAREWRSGFCCALGNRPHTHSPSLLPPSLPHNMHGLLAATIKHNHHKQPREHDVALGHEGWNYGGETGRAPQSR